VLKDPGKLGEKGILTVVSEKTGTHP
jgi:hypothetical protein